MNPLPGPMRSMNALKRYENECKLSPDERHKKKCCFYCRKKTEKEPHWNLEKTIECVWPTLKDSIIYRFFQNGFEFSMPFFMRFYLKDLKRNNPETDPKKEERRAWFILVMACLAVIACFLGGLCRERANFFTGASKAKAGQTLRSLVYKK